MILIKVGLLIAANYVENGKDVKKSEKKDSKLSILNASYFDGRKDATQMVVKGPNDKHYRYFQLEELCAVVGKPGSHYLTFFSPEDGKGRTIAKNLINSIHGTELENKLAVVGTDGTTSMTGKKWVHLKFGRATEDTSSIGCVPATYQRATFETCLCKSWCGSTSSPDTFLGLIGKKQQGFISNWPITNFEQPLVPLSSFPTLPPLLVNDFNTDQFNLYKVCLAVTHGKVDDDSMYLKVAPIVHSRWLNLGCRTLHYYVPQNGPLWIWTYWFAFA